MDLARKASFLLAGCGLAAIAIMALGCRSGGGGGHGSDPGSVHGRIIIPDRVDIDSDTRDDRNSYAPNDEPVDGQSIDNLVTVMGHVFDSSTPSDPDDPVDIFSAILSAGEKVALRSVDPAADIDLYLLAGSTVIDSSTSADQSKSVTAPADGQYYLKVAATTGGSIYNLLLGASSAASAAFGNWSESAEFAPGEALVMLKRPGKARERGKQDRGVKARGLDLAARHGARLGRAGPMGLCRIEFDLQDHGAGLSAEEKLAGKKRQTLERIKELNADPEVAYAEPNFVVRAASSDTYFPLQWNLEMIYAPGTWDYSTVDREAVVAVLDTGVLYDHPDLMDNVLFDGSTVVGYDLVHDLSISIDGDTSDPDPYDPGDGVTGQASSFHGTHVAGIVAASIDNGLGVAGASASARIMPVRVLGRNNSGYTEDLVRGILFAAGLDPLVTPMVGGATVVADVINMSLGGSDTSQALQDAVNAARAEGSILVAAAGNNHNSFPYYPASCQGVIGVSAVDLAANPTYYTNYGNAVDLAAPGGDMFADLDNDGNDDGIVSTGADDTGAYLEFDYVFYHGTSMATPHVSAVMALMRSINPAITPEQMDLIIQGQFPGADSITDRAPGDRDNFKGYGLINAEKALSAAIFVLDGSTGAVRLGVVPSGLFFGTAIDQLTARVVNLGGGVLAGLTVEDYSADMPWLFHQMYGATIDFSVNRDLMSPGLYTHSVLIGSTGWGDTISLLISAAKADVMDSDVGTVYVGLYNPATEDVPYVTVTNAAMDYYFSLNRVAPGTYLLFATTDIDGDDMAFDAGELYGEYPSSAHPQYISVQEGKASTMMDFDVDFTGLPPQTAAEDAGPIPPGIGLGKD